MFLYAAGLTTNDYRRELWLIRLMYLNTLIYPWLYFKLHKESVRWFFLLVLRCSGRCCVKPRKNTRTLKCETLQVQSAILIEKYISLKVYKLYTEIWFLVHKTWSSLTSFFRCHWCHCLDRGAKQSIGVGKMGHFLIVIIYNLVCCSQLEKITSEWRLSMFYWKCAQLTILDI